MRDIVLTGKGVAEGLVLQGSALRDHDKMMRLVSHSDLADRHESSSALRFNDFAANDSSMDLLLAMQLHEVMIDEAIALGDSLAAKSVEAKAASVAKTRFLATMSHELRTPLNGMVGLLDMLYRNAEEGHTRSMLEIVNKSADTLVKILNDILDTAKIEAGNLVIDPVATDLRSVLNDTADLYRPATTEKNVQIVIEAANTFPSSVRIDPHRVKQMVGNILSNSVKFTENGQIIIRLAADMSLDSPELTIVIQDTGIGFDPEKAKTLFDAFTQADASTTRIYGGTGLGLTIVRELSVLMGGSVTASSELGEGSCFTIRLPLDIVEENEMAAPQALRS